ncbi:YsnF/AvaK domain-containing protein, partial [Streptomyces olivaceus]|uniref:YsnF/AvaK domain-containing protein n=1 Tax=Streptomyces olivaceus TaxID=47716 RepID=UPI004056EFB2
GSGTAGAAGTVGAAGLAGTGRAGTGRAGTDGGTTGREDAWDRADMTDERAMTRSEEQMHIGVERRESGRARLRKYVVTEEVQQTVPVTHEEVRVVREPITDANRDEALAGPEISEAEHEVTLHAERPVVETETVPVERVRMTMEEHTENETVRGQVRKERIEAETELIEEDDMRRDRE